MPPRPPWPQRSTRRGGRGRQPALSRTVATCAAGRKGARASVDLTDGRLPFLRHRGGQGPLAGSGRDRAHLCLPGRPAGHARARARGPAGPHRLSGGHHRRTRPGAGGNDHHGAIDRRLRGAGGPRLSPGLQRGRGRPQLGAPPAPARARGAAHGLASRLTRGNLTTATVPSTQVKILVPDNHLMVGLVGQRDELLRLIEGAFDDVLVIVRGNEITITGDEADRVGKLFEELVVLLQQGHRLDAANVNRTIDMVKADERPSEVLTAEVLKSARGRTVRPKSSGQKRYVDSIERNVITFAIGPAGTGKSYLAVAAGIRALQDKLVSRIILTRP